MTADAGISPSMRLLRVRGQFDRPGADLAVATPTCCCCCCLVSTTTLVAYSSSAALNEARRADAPHGHRVRAGWAGLLAPLALLVTVILARPWPPGGLVVGAAVYVLVNLWVLGIAGRERREIESRLGESLLVIVVFAVAFGIELVTFGFLLWGQLGALFVPLLVAKWRANRGHQPKGTPRMVYFPQQPPE